MDLKNAIKGLARLEGLAREDGLVLVEFPHLTPHDAVRYQYAATAEKVLDEVLRDIGPLENVQHPRPRTAGACRWRQFSGRSWHELALRFAVAMTATVRDRATNASGVFDLVANWDNVGSYLRAIPASRSEVQHLLDELDCEAELLNGNEKTRRVAAAKPKAPKRRKAKHTDLLVSYLLRHHRYDDGDGGGVEALNAARPADISRDLSINKGTITRELKKLFPNQKNPRESGLKQYEAVCNKGETSLVKALQKLANESTPFQQKTS